MKKWIILIAAMLFSLNTYADYFKGGLGYSLDGEVKLKGPGGSVTADQDNSVIFPFLAAYGFEVFDELNGEVEVSYRKNDYKDDSSVNSKVLTVAFNMVGNVPLTEMVYLSGGLGVNFGSYDVGVPQADKGTALGVQAFGGVDFKIQENLKLGGEFRYMTTVTDINVGSGVDAEYNNAALLFLAKFSM